VVAVEHFAAAGASIDSGTASASIAAVHSLREGRRALTSEAWRARAGEPWRDRARGDVVLLEQRCPADRARPGRARIDRGRSSCPGRRTRRSP
jgi:hypothetical protein